MDVASNMHPARRIAPVLKPVASEVLDEVWVDPSFVSYHDIKLRSVADRLGRKAVHVKWIIAPRGLERTVAASSRGDWCGIDLQPQLVDADCFVLEVRNVREAALGLVGAEILKDFVVVASNAKLVLVRPLTKPRVQFLH
jgi:hypothetical protein